MGVGTPVNPCTQLICVKFGLCPNFAEQFHLGGESALNHVIWWRRRRVALRVRNGSRFGVVTSLSRSLVLGVRAGFGSPLPCGRCVSGSSLPSLPLSVCAPAHPAVMASGPVSCGRGTGRRGGRLPGGGSTPSQPGLQFGDRSGQVHGALRAQCPLGSGLGAGPTLARLFRAHPPSVGSPHWQWRSGRLHRTREEASEARVDVLGCDLGSAEAGACSAASAGEAADPIRFRPLCGLRLAGWLERGSVRCSWVRFLGGAVLNCWDGGAAKIASSGMADGSHATKVNHFYNG